MTRGLENVAIAFVAIEIDPLEVHCLSGDFEDGYDEAIDVVEDRGIKQRHFRTAFLLSRPQPLQSGVRGNINTSTKLSSSNI